LTVGIVVAAVAVAAWIGAQMWSRRGKTGVAQWQSFPASQTANLQPSATVPTVNSPVTDAHLNQVSDAQSTVHSAHHRQRRHHTTVPSSEAPGPEGSDTSKTEGQT